jgi:hypothetical protein
MRVKKTMVRLWDHDHTVWRDDPRVIANRFGWLPALFHTIVLDDHFGTRA